MMPIVGLCAVLSKIYCAEIFTFSKEILKVKQNELSLKFKLKDHDHKIESGT